MLIVRKEIKLALGITAAVLGVAVVYGGMSLLSTSGGNIDLSEAWQAGGAEETLALNGGDGRTGSSLDEAVPGLPPIEGSPADLAAANRTPIAPTDPFAETVRTDGAATTDRWATAWNTGRVGSSSTEIAPVREPPQIANPLAGGDSIRPPGPSVGNTTEATAAAPLPAAGTYKIQAGDTYSKIAAKLYNNRNLYHLIEKANPGVNPSKLKIGQEINVPAAPASSASARDALTPAAPEITGAIDATRQYRVQPGDTLHKISQKLYGKTKFWAALYDANKQKIGPDAGKLKVGTVLTLPHVPTAN